MKKKIFIFITSFYYFTIYTVFAQNPGGGQSDEIIIANKNIL